MAKARLFLSGGLPQASAAVGGNAARQGPVRSDNAAMSILGEIAQPAGRTS